MARKLVWGVLSTATIGVEKVLPAMQRGTFCEIRGLASRDLSKAQATAAALGIPQAYGSYEELLADPAIEAVYNPLPNHLHVPWTIRALEAGKHVLCEKPLALTADEARQLIEVSARTQRVVGEAFMVRHHPQWLAVKAMVGSGRVGDVRAIATLFSYFLTDPANVRNQADIGGGGLYDIGCYAINTARFLFGSEPERVVALFDRDPVLRIDRMASALAAFPGARHLTFTCSTQMVPHQRVQILGTTGRIEIAIPFNADPTAVSRILVDDGSDLAGAGIETIEIPAADQYTLQGDAFSRAVLEGRPLDWGLADSVANMQVIDALFRSGESQRWEVP